MANVADIQAKVRLRVYPNAAGRIGIFFSKKTLRGRHRRDYTAETTRREKARKQGTYSPDTVWLWRHKD